MSSSTGPAIDLNAPAWVTNAKVKEWVAAMAALTTPDRIHWCDGSKEEYDRLCNDMVKSGTFI